MEQLTITVYKTVDENFYFRLRDESDNIVLTSIQYSSCSNCFNDIYVMQMYGDMDFTLEKCPETSRRKFYLKLKGHRIIAESPEYILERTLKEDLTKIIRGLRHAVLIDMCSTVRFYRKVRAT